MKTMTENEFIELISSTDDWTIETASGDVQENVAGNLPARQGRSS